MQVEELEKKISTKKKELDKLQDALKEATKDKTYCPRCKKYFYEYELATGQYTDTVHQCVWNIGLSDEYADVTYLYKVVRCPKCGKELSRKAMKLFEENNYFKEV